MPLVNTFRTDNGFNNPFKPVGSKSSGYSTPTSARGVSSGSSGSWQSMLQAISDSNNAFNLAQVDAVNAFNSAEAQKNRDWQERMSNTAHQREVKDLIEAGLNPILSAGGQGAVTGSGAVASGQKAVADNTFGQGMISLMSSLISASSAQSVAQIYAGASMYGSDKNYALGLIRDSHSTGKMLSDSLDSLVSILNKSQNSYKNWNKTQILDHYGL